MKSIVLATLLMGGLLFHSSLLFGQVTSQPFEFQFENKTLRGFIETPKNRQSRALVIIIPGYGRTNFAKGRSFNNTRRKLLSFGLTVCVWDKMGCGNSEGTFDINQPVENSAAEALAVIQKIKQLNVPGSAKIGVWGISRAGWICPLLNERYPLDFWISVSGTSDKENFGYLLKSNLLIAGKTAQEAERLYQAWMLGHKIYCTGGSYEDYFKARHPLMLDDIARKIHGRKAIPKMSDAAKKRYLKSQKSFISSSKGHFDTKSGLWSYINDFDKILLKFKCPVLALFGENDTQVDWRDTKKLYENTLGKNPQAQLTIKTFKKCNHNIQKCITCAYRENLSALGWQACDGYYKAMQSWLKTQQLID